MRPLAFACCGTLAPIPSCVPDCMRTELWTEASVASLVLVVLLPAEAPEAVDTCGWARARGEVGVSRGAVNPVFPQLGG